MRTATKFHVQAHQNDCDHSHEGDDPEQYE